MDRGTRTPLRRAGRCTAYRSSSRTTSTRSTCRRRRARRDERLGAARRCVYSRSHAQGGRADPRQGQPAEFARGGSRRAASGPGLEPVSFTRTPGGSAAAPAGHRRPTWACSAPAATPDSRSVRRLGNEPGRRPPTRGLVSRAGVIPNSLTQDEIGPIARQCESAALLLVRDGGFRPDDPITAFGSAASRDSYTERLECRRAEGARIGVMTNLSARRERQRTSTGHGGR